MVRAFLGLALLVARLAAAYPRTCATARTRGLSCADHNVTTRDGYVLETHTVWNARVASPARVVVLQHGLIDSSETWVANYGGESLARQLADDGWLVYLANSRGRPPYRHATLGPDDAAFWAFSWDEMAALDSVLWRRRFSREFDRGNEENS
ncbi:hydrolase [Aureococcus anophagefferens]|nr:hydrolase [Aureococcus anophagefferens]